MSLNNKNAKGAGAILINKSGEIVLQKRTLDALNNTGLIGIFGGKLEEGETVKQCLARELLEELELDINAAKHNLVYLHKIESRSTPGLFNHFL